MPVSSKITNVELKQELSKQSLVALGAFGIAAILILLIMHHNTTVYMAIATGNFMVLCLGMTVRTQKLLHAIIMAAAISSDLLLVLVIELQRSAIKTATSFTLNHWQQAHIISSSIATLLYIPLVILGILLLKNSALRSKLRPWHIRLGIVAFISRAIGFLLMFSMLSR